MASASACVRARRPPPRASRYDLTLSLITKVLLYKMSASIAQVPRPAATACAGSMSRRRMLNGVMSRMRSGPSSSVSARAGAMDSAPATRRVAPSTLQDVPSHMASLHFRHGASLFTDHANVTARDESRGKPLRMRRLVSGVSRGKVLSWLFQIRQGVRKQSAEGSVAALDGGGTQAVLLHPIVELGARDAQEARGARAVVLRVLESLHDQVALHGLEVEAARRRQGRAVAGGRLDRVGFRADADRQMLHRDQPAVAEDRRALQGVAQLAHVPRPGIGEQRLVPFARNTRRGTAHDRPDLLQEGLRHRQDVVPPLP